MIPGCWEDKAQSKEAIYINGVKMMQYSRNGFDGWRLDYYSGDDYPSDTVIKNTGAGIVVKLFDDEGCGSEYRQSGIRVDFAIESVTAIDGGETRIWNRLDPQGDSCKGYIDSFPYPITESTSNGLKWLSCRTNSYGEAVIFVGMGDVGYNHTPEQEKQYYQWNPDKFINEDEWIQEVVNIVIKIDGWKGHNNFEARASLIVNKAPYQHFWDSDSLKGLISTCWLELDNNYQNQNLPENNNMLFEQMPDEPLKRLDNYEIKIKTKDRISPVPEESLEILYDIPASVGNEPNFVYDIIDFDFYQMKFDEFYHVWYWDILDKIRPFRILESDGFDLQDPNNLIWDELDQSWPVCFYAVAERDIPNYNPQPVSAVLRVMKSTTEFIEVEPNDYTNPIWLTIYDPNNNGIKHHILDINQDMKIDLFEYNGLSKHYGKTNDPNYSTDPNFIFPKKWDFDRSGKIDHGDLVELQSGWLSRFDVKMPVYDMQVASYHIFMYPVGHNEAKSKWGYMSDWIWCLADETGDIAGNWMLDSFGYEHLAVHLEPGYILDVRPVKNHDYNGDRITDLYDYFFFVSHWLTFTDDIFVNSNNDSIVNMVDLNEFIKDFGKEY